MGLWLGYLGGQTYWSVHVWNREDLGVLGEFTSDLLFFFAVLCVLHRYLLGVCGVGRTRLPSSLSRLLGAACAEGGGALIVFLESTLVYVGSRVTPTMTARRCCEHSTCG